MDESEDPHREHQPELPLPFPELTGDQPLLPARMINEFTYCPRLAYLEWVQGEWADSGDTVDGRRVHRRVDRKSDKTPAPDEAIETFHARSVELSSNRLGLIGKLDLLEDDGDAGVTPVDYKRGKRPHVARGAYEPERIQLCVQGMLLEDHGYRCERGILYFAGSRERVHVEFDEQLREATSRAITGLRSMADAGQIPPPLEDSLKCPRCSLVGICLPDEVNFLKRGDTPPRPLSVNQDEALPLYVQSHSAKVARKGEELVISVKDEVVQKARIRDVSQLVLMGNVYVTSPTLTELMRREIPVSWHSYGGWFIGHTQGIGHKNVELRTAQYAASFEGWKCLRIAKGLVETRILNSRTLLRRNWRGDEEPKELLAQLKQDARSVRKAESLSALLGIEGTAAARYFGAFDQIIKPEADRASFTFDFTRRRRRPPPDPVNALLSYAYSVLSRSFSVALSAIGFDPYRGFY